ncbi:hypothetical protein [Hymenobacter koreensis]|uniref:Receptor L-domain domain-containing protein n=1 Tax=Hymenobacter koreensis TaxID=1084523 RepID=A0ABP8JNR2_9BACT
MMKRLLLFAFFCACLTASITGAQAQTCNLAFNTQAQVNAYLASGNRCSTVDNLSITGAQRLSDGTLTPGVTDVSGLLHITAVTGIVQLQLNELANLGGLANIEQIGGNLMIGGAASATGLNIFPNLRRVGGEIRFMFNPALTSISGFGQLQSANILYIALNQNLTSVSGFGALTTLGYFYIAQNPALRSINGFQSLRTVTGGTQGGIAVNSMLWITNNPVLETIPDFASLASVEYLNIIENGRLLMVGALIGCARF